MTGIRSYSYAYLHGLWYIPSHSSPFVWNRSNQTIHTPVLHFSCLWCPPPPQTVPLTPLSRLAPRLRRSVEGLNLELEGVFVSETPEDQHKVSMFKYSQSAWVPAGLVSLSQPSMDPLDSPIDRQLAHISLQWPVSHSLTVPSPCSPVRSWMSQMATEPQFLPRGAAVVPRVSPPLPRSTLLCSLHLSLPVP